MDRKSSKPTEDNEKSSGNEPGKKARHDSLGQVRRQRIMSHVPKPQPPPPQESASSPAIKTIVTDQPQTRSTVELTAKDHNHDEDKKKKKLVKPEFPKPAPLNLPIDDLMKTFGVTKQKVKKSGDDDEDEGDKLRNVVIKSMKKNPEKFDPILQSTMQQTRKTSEDLKEKLRTAFKLPKKDPGVAVPFTAKEMDKRIKKKEEIHKKSDKEEVPAKENSIDDDFSDHNVFQDDTKYQNYPKDEHSTRKRRPNTELHMAHKDAPSVEKEKRNSLEIKADAQTKTKIPVPKTRTVSLERGDKTIALANKGSGLFSVKRPVIDRTFDPNLGVASLAKPEPKPEARKPSIAPPPPQDPVLATPGQPTAATRPGEKAMYPAKDTKPRKPSAELPKPTNANAASVLPGIPAQAHRISLPEKELQKPQEGKTAPGNDLVGKAIDRVGGSKGVSEPTAKSTEPRKSSGTEPIHPVAHVGKILPVSTAVAAAPTIQIPQPAPPVSPPRQTSIPTSQQAPTRVPGTPMAAPMTKPVQTVSVPVPLLTTPGTITTPKALTPPPVKPAEVVTTPAPLVSTPVQVVTAVDPPTTALARVPAAPRPDSIVAPAGGAPAMTSIDIETTPTQLTTKPIPTTTVPLGTTSVTPALRTTAPLGTKTTPIAEAVATNGPSMNTRDGPLINKIPPLPAPTVSPARTPAVSTIGQPMATPAPAAGISQPEPGTEPRKSVIPDTAATPIPVTEPISTDSTPRKMSIKQAPTPSEISPESMPTPILPATPLVAEPQAKTVTGTGPTKVSDVKPAEVTLPPPTATAPVAATAPVKPKAVPATIIDSGKPGPTPTAIPGTIAPPLPHVAAAGIKPPPASVQQIPHSKPKPPTQGVASKQASAPGGPAVKLDPALDKHGYDIPTTHGKSREHGTHKPKAAATIRDLRKRGQKERSSSNPTSPRKTSDGYPDSNKPNIVIQPTTAAVEQKKPDDAAPIDPKKLHTASVPPPTELKKPIIPLTPPIEPVKPVPGPLPAAEPLKQVPVTPTDPKRTIAAPSPPESAKPIPVPTPTPLEPAKAVTVSPPPPEPVKPIVAAPTETRKPSVVPPEPKRLSLAIRPVESRKLSSAAPISTRGAKMSTAGAATDKVSTNASRTGRSSSLAGHSAKQLKKPSLKPGTQIPSLKRQASVPNLKTRPILKSGGSPAAAPSKQVQGGVIKGKPQFKELKIVDPGVKKASAMTLATQLILKPTPKPKTPHTVKKLGEKNEEEMAKGFLNKLTQKVMEGGDLSHLQDFGIPEQRRLLNLILHSDFGDYEFGGYMRECYSPVLRGFCAMNLQERYRGAGRGEECFSGLDISKIGTKIQFKDRDRVKKLEDRDVHLSDLRDVAIDDKHFNFLKELANNQPVSIPLTIIHELSAEILPMIKDMWEYYAKNLGTNHECTMQAGRSFIQLLNRVIMYNNL